VQALRASGLVKRFGQTTAVDAVDLMLDAGEVRGVLGANGAGKTTLLRLLFGLITPDAGAVELLGRPLDRLAPGALQAVGGFVEDPCFYPYLTARANLALLARLDGLGAAEAVAGRTIERALDRVDLAHRAEQRVSGYSTGMRQRLGIAAALLRNPRLLLLDEPTSGLDPAGARAVTTLVRELAADGVAVLLSSHQIGELEKVCDSYTVMRRGAVVWSGTAAALATQAPAPAYALATSDDARALELAGERPGVRVRVRRSSEGPPNALVVTAQPEALDAFVLALGDDRVVLRRLELLVSPLESMFFALTEGAVSSALDRDELTDQLLAAVGR
jgi:ABC-2 type transport system ATP-binding protein